MKLSVLGCGDAFGSGGRLQTSYHLEDGSSRLLIDCGATALIGMQRAGLAPGKVTAIQVSHLHGDHFSGIVWWLLHALFVDRRRVPLSIAGPKGIERRVWQAAEVLFPGALSPGDLPFELGFIEQTSGRQERVGGFDVTPFEVSHPSGAAAHALRIERGGRTISFSGDTEWVETLVDCARGSDLFLCECHAFDRPVRHHMNWSTLSRELPRTGASRVVLTHMGDDMLAAGDVARKAGVELAHDGMVIEV